MKLFSEAVAIFLSDVKLEVQSTKGSKRNAETKNFIPYH